MKGKAHAKLDQQNPDARHYTILYGFLTMNEAIHEESARFASAVVAAHCSAARDQAAEKGAGRSNAEVRRYSYLVARNIGLQGVSGYHHHWFLATERLNHSQPSFSSSSKRATSKLHTQLGQLQKVEQGFCSKRRSRHSSSGHYLLVHRAALKALFFVARCVYNIKRAYRRVGAV